MCNLYRLPEDVRDLARPLRGAAWPTPNKAEMYPGYHGPVVVRAGAAVAVETMRWGFPTTRPNKRDPSKTVTEYWTNARNLDAGLWRSWIGKAENRCLVPVKQFAEPDSSRGKRGNAWFEMADGAGFCFAGLWKPTDDGPHFAFLTCPPNEIVGAIHPKAMPVILAESDYDSWLSGAKAADLQRPFPAEAMRLAA